MCMLFYVAGLLWKIFNRFPRYSIGFHYHECGVIDYGLIIIAKLEEREGEIPLFGII